MLGANLYQYQERLKACALEIGQLVEIFFRDWYYSKKERKYKNKSKKQRQKNNWKKEQFFEKMRKKERKHLLAFIKIFGIPFLIFCFIKNTYSQDVMELPDCIPGHYNLIIRGTSNTWMGKTSCFCIPSFTKNIVYLKCNLALNEKVALIDYTDPCESGIYDVYVDYAYAMLRTTRTCTCKEAFWGNTISLDCNNQNTDFEMYYHEDICDEPLRRNINTNSKPICKQCYLPPVNNTVDAFPKEVILCNTKEIPSQITPLIVAALGSSALTSGCLGICAGACIAGGILYYKLKKARSKEKTPEIKIEDYSSEQTNNTSDSNSDSNAESSSITTSKNQLTNSPLIL